MYRLIKILQKWTWGKWKQTEQNTEAEGSNKNTLFKISRALNLYIHSKIFMFFMLFLIKSSWSFPVFRMSMNSDEYVEIHTCSHVFHNLEGCLTSCGCWWYLCKRIYNKGSSSTPLFNYTAYWVHHLIEGLNTLPDLKCSLMNLLLDSLLVDYQQLSVI